MQSGHQIPNEQFATICANLLNRHILEAGRTSAKRIFRELEEGRTVTLNKLRMEDDRLVQIDMTLDTEAFNGNINYSAFRDGVLALLAKLTDILKENKPLPIFHPLEENGGVPEESKGTRLFGAGGVTIHDGTPNMLLLGARPDPERPIVTLQLLYVDPNQFVDSASTS